VDTKAIKLKPGITQVDCEEIITTISIHPIDALELPARLETLRAIGLESTIISLIVTWVRTSTKPHLILTVSEDEIEKYLAQLCQTAYGLTALSLSKVVTTSNGNEIEVKKIKAVINKRLNEFDDRNLKILAPDEGVSLLSIYNHPREHGKWLYAQPDGTIGAGMLMPDQFGSWLSHLISQMLPPEFRALLDEERMNSICAAAYELLENAFNHGRLNIHAEPLKIGVCGLSIRVLKVSFDDVNILSSGNKDAHLYFTQRLLKDKTKDRLFIEMTVFDSGIGYHDWINAPCNESTSTQRFRGKDERTTVQDCILKHATSKRSDGAGVGLFRVLRLLKDLFGFIRIRTGKTCFYARLDLKEDGSPRLLGEREPQHLASHIDLHDWHPQLKLPQSSGTAVTICIPLTHWSTTK